MGTSGPPSMNTRSRCKTVTIAALAITSPTNAQLWTPRSLKTKSEKLMQPNKIAYAVLEGDKF